MEPTSMQRDHYYAIIMAGGGGTRLWPLSRKKRPKQMLNLSGENTLFQDAVRRITPVFPPEQIYVITVAEQAEELRKQTPEIPAENFLLEPAPRGTASVVGLGAAALHQRDPQAVMAVLTADHFIGNEELFLRLLSGAYDVAEENYLVTLGIEPTFASTGFGYIQHGQALNQFQALNVHQVLRFTEKPAQEQAQDFLNQGGYSWNSGMFFWRVDRIREEFERQMPVLFAGLQEIEAAWDTASQAEAIHKVWGNLQSETIDYGIMERANRTAVISAAELGWNDVGSWDALFEVLPHDENGNIRMGSTRFIGLETADTLVYSPSDERLVVTIGVKDLVVVDTGDVLLVCHKDEAQRVRDIVSVLKKQGTGFI
jgi:mannose-1-phosphate guanylyltransferase